MINQLKQWQGACEINGQRFDSFPVDFNDFSDMIHIKLYPSAQKREESTGNDEKRQSTSTVVNNNQLQIGHTYEITVKQYMTRKATPEFDFMANFNNDIPMPLRTMVGTVIKETKGMYFLELKGQAKKEIRCLRCGRELTNQVSRMYGIGPECITKIPVFFDIDINDVEGIKEKMQEVKWSGWCIKSAITEVKEID